MEYCLVIGSVLFFVSLAQGLFLLVGSRLKWVGVDGGTGISLFFLLSACLFYLFQVLIYSLSPDLWGEVLIFAAMNLVLVLVQNLCITDAVILGKKHIYLIGHAFVIHRYGWEEVSNCSGSYDSGWLYSRYGRKHTSLFRVKVRFLDGRCGKFSVKNKDDKKANYFRERIKTMKQQEKC